MKISGAQFWNVPDVAGLPTFSYAELLAQLSLDIPSGGPQAGFGALVFRNASQAIPTATSTDAIWDEIVYDDLGFADIAGANPERLTIPDVDPPIRRIIVGGYVPWNQVASSTKRVITTRKNGGFPGTPLFPAGVDEVEQNPTGTLGSRMSLVSGPEPVVVGDYFTITLRQDSGADLGAIRIMMHIRAI